MAGEGALLPLELKKFLNIILPENLTGNLTNTNTISRWLFFFFILLVVSLFN